MMMSLTVRIKNESKRSDNNTDISEWFKSIQNIWAVGDELIVADGNWNRKTTPELKIFTLDGQFLRKFSIEWNGIFCQAINVQLTIHGNYFIRFQTTPMERQLIRHAFFTKDGKFIRLFQLKLPSGDQNWKDTKKQESRR